MVRVGIIGCGNISPVHARGYRAAGAEIVAVADVCATARARLAEESGAPEQYGSAADLIHNARVDAVSVALPNHLHAPVTIAALEAGLHVLCEKPMALNRGQAAEMTATARRCDRLLMLGMNQRFIPSVIKAAELARAGTFGDIYHVEATQVRRYGIPGLGGWFTTEKLAGAGPLFDFGSHAFDRAWYIMGKPKPVKVFAVAHARFGTPIKDYQYSGTMYAGPPAADGVKDVEDFDCAIVRFENGSSLLLRVSWAQHPLAPAKLTHILGDKAGAIVGDGPDLKLFTITNNEPNDTVIPCKPDDSTGRFRHFIDCIERKTQCICPPEEGCVVQAVLDAALESGRSGAEADVDLGGVCNGLWSNDE